MCHFMLQCMVYKNRYHAFAHSSYHKVIALFFLLLAKSIPIKKEDEQDKKTSILRTFLNLCKDVFYFITRFMINHFRCAEDIL